MSLCSFQKFKIKSRPNKSRMNENNFEKADQFPFPSENFSCKLHSALDTFKFFKNKST